jgi:prepilin-type N-terminal cleavage/methylation domain-containing protein
MTNKGFTLIETLIAVLVLMMAITGPLTLAEKGLHVTLIAKDQDTAFYLAQDAIEYVRWVRDTNKLSGGDWLTGAGGGGNIRDLTVCKSASGSTQCRVDSLQNLQTTIVGCSGDTNGVCKPLQYNSTNNYFSYTSGTASIFTRTVSIATPVGSNSGEAAVIVTVSWYDQGSLQRSITVRENIFDWQ